MDYKKYSLENLENWIHDAMSAGEASPQEIYDTIHKVVEENYYIYKEQTAKAYELLSLLNGNGKGHIEAYDDYVKEVLSEKEYYEPSMPPWGHSDMEYMVHNSEDKVVKWQLPIEINAGGEYFVSFPDDLLEQVGWKEGDTVEYVPSENGFYVMRKV